MTIDARNIVKAILWIKRRRRGDTLLEPRGRLRRRKANTLADT
jgi:hypothetical protein